MNPLGNPIGQNPIGQRTHNPTDGFDKGHQGEDGAGIGVGGGHIPSASNQSGAARSGFNAGLGGEHASGGLPGTGSHGAHPIADKFMGQSSGSSEPVSGAYAGSGSRDALTGESHATRTGAGVGPLGENLGSGQHQGHSHQTDSALAGTAAGAAAASGLGAGNTHGSHSHGASDFGTGVGAAGGAGGHYNPVAADSADSTRTSGGSTNHHGTHGHPAGIGAAAVGGLGAGAAATGLSGHNDHKHGSSGVGGAGAAGAGALGTGAGGAGLYEAQRAGAHGTHGDSGVTGRDLAAGGAAGGLAGAAAGGHRGDSSSHHKESENTRGTPLSDPKEIDSGGRHGLVFQESTGTYVHRHELDDKKA